MDVPIGVLGPNRFAERVEIRRVGLTSAVAVLACADRRASHGFAIHLNAAGIPSTGIARRAENPSVVSIWKHLYIGDGIDRRGIGSRKAIGMFVIFELGLEDQIPVLTLLYTHLINKAVHAPRIPARIGVASVGGVVVHGPV